MKVYVDTIGCRLNQSEIEKIAAQFREEGYEITADPAAADLVVVNTCAVTAKASADSRKAIRHAGRSGHAQLVVTGCWATLSPAEAGSMPGVSRVVSNLQKDQLVTLVMGREHPLETNSRQPLPGSRKRTRAFIKVQDGCDNFCTYCVTRVARGSARSVPVPEVLADVRAAVDGGAKEVVLTGVHLGSWGQEFAEKKHLQDLVKKILKETDVPRVRLSSLEPWDLHESFFSLWENSRLCPHLHLPLQSGSQNTLRRMARKISPMDFFKLVETARRYVPEVAITTDMIVGFPGETEQDFEESLNFAREISFAGGHVFAFSPREGTPAARYEGQVDIQVKKQRSERLRHLFAEMEKSYSQEFVGKVVGVLWENQNENGLLKGLSGNYLKISAVAKQNLWNEISQVKIIKKDGKFLAGEIL